MRVNLYIKVKIIWDEIILKNQISNGVYVK